MSTRVNVPVARGGNVVVFLLRLDVQLREIFATVACCWYCARSSDWMTSVVRCRFDQLQRCVTMLRLVPAERSVMRCFVLATGYPASGSEDCVSYATSFEHQFPYLEYFPVFRSLFLRTLEHCSAVSFSGEFPSFPVVVLLVRGCEGERQYHTLISLLGSLATMRRVVNYHSSWVRQRQVELFYASGIRVLYHGEWLITTL
ncbi:hypothetical protein F511_28266 [Dorcoceras hygrometricum]|uniref:Uncharacterized protein n=1 Tax=Dorcoceras hygrometricum TaxID=472368 RepID=A0A2Z7BCF4_9LAMI|nr:hypothetical protein F511_28266 [Dorcoceras hygrometricum]